MATNIGTTGLNSQVENKRRGFLYICFEDLCRKPLGVLDWLLL